MWPSCYLQPFITNLQYFEVHFQSTKAICCFCANLINIFLTLALQWLLRAFITTSKRISCHVLTSMKTEMTISALNIATCKKISIHIQFSFLCIYSYLKLLDRKMSWSVGRTAKGSGRHNIGNNNHEKKNEQSELMAKPVKKCGDLPNYPKSELSEILQYNM